MLNADDDGEMAQYQEAKQQETVTEQRLTGTS